VEALDNTDAARAVVVVWTLVAAAVVQPVAPSKLLEVDEEEEDNTQDEDDDDEDVAQAVEEAAVHTWEGEDVVVAHKQLQEEEPVVVVVVVEMTDASLLSVVDLFDPAGVDVVVSMLIDVLVDEDVAVAVVVPWYWPYLVGWFVPITYYFCPTLFLFSYCWFVAF
jgi:hypothetical protein